MNECEYTYSICYVYSIINDDRIFRYGHEYKLKKLNVSYLVWILLKIYIYICNI